MSRKSRTKGASYEREIVNILRDCGYDCARNLDQTRDGGGDIPHGRFLIECKRRRTIMIYRWWDQCLRACFARQEKLKPMLVIRADRRENLVVLSLDDYLELANPGSMEPRVPSASAQG